MVCVGILIGYLFPFLVRQSGPLLCNYALCCRQYFSVVRRPCMSLLVYMYFSCMLISVLVSVCPCCDNPETCFKSSLARSL